MEKNIWRPIEIICHQNTWSNLDYAVREQVKVHLTAHIRAHIKELSLQGLTFERLIQIQQELDLCPSLLELHPHGENKRQISPWKNFWRDLHKNLATFF